MKLVWDVTWKCNLRCKHCSAFFSLSDCDSELTLAEKINLIDVTCDNHGLSSVHFLGGEPFALSHFLDLFEYCQYRRLKTTIVTNGTLLEDDIILAYLSKVQYPTTIIFSLDGPDKDTNDAIRGNGSFQKCTNNIMQLNSLAKRLGKSQYLSIQLAGTISKANLDVLHDYVILCNQLKAFMLNFATIAITGNATNNADLFAIDDNVEFINSIHRLYRSYKESGSTFPLILDLPKKVVNYLNNRYSVKCFSKGFSCSFLDGTIRIDGKGIVEKCKYFTGSEHFSEIVKKAEYKIQDDSFYLYPSKKLKMHINQDISDNKRSAKELNCKFSDECISCFSYGTNKPNCKLCQQFIDYKYDAMT